MNRQPYFIAPMGISLWHKKAPADRLTEAVKVLIAFILAISSWGPFFISTQEAYALEELAPVKVIFHFHEGGYYSEVADYSEYEAITTNEYFTQRSVNGSGVYFVANNHPDAVKVDASGLRWRVMLNYAAASKEGNEDVPVDITSEATYDAKKGIVSLPGKYAEKDITVAWYVSRDNAAAVPYKVSVDKVIDGVRTSAEIEKCFDPDTNFLSLKLFDDLEAAGHVSWISVKQGGVLLSESDYSFRNGYLAVTTSVLGGELEVKLGDHTEVQNEAGADATVGFNDVSRTGETSSGFGLFSVTNPVVGETFSIHDAIIVGQDFGQSGSGWAYGWPDKEGRYGFYVSILNAEDSAVKQAGNKGNGGYVTSNNGNVYDDRWAANHHWLWGTCKGDVADNGAGSHVFTGGFVRVEAIDYQSQTVSYYFEVTSVSTIDGHAMQTVCGYFSAPKDLGGYLDIQKVSGNPSLTQGNNCYSLEKALYGVYKSNSDAQTDTGRVASLSTNSSGYAKSVFLSAGTYYVKEVSAPRGYALDDQVYSVAVNAGATSRVNGSEVFDVPQNSPTEEPVSKLDKQTGQGFPQGGALLKGAEFTVRYYAGFFNTGDTSWIAGATPTRTWVVKAGNDGTAYLNESHKVSGSAFYLNSRNEVCFPLGTVTIQENKAPLGYLLNSDDVIIRQIKSEGMLEDVQAFEGASIKDEVIRGGVSILKIDRESSLNSALGAGSVDGAIFNIRTKNPNPVLVDGVKYQNDEVVASITSVDGVAQTASDTLPYGDYEIYEAVAPLGYTLSSEIVSFSITEQGEMVNLKGVDAIDDQVIRGDLEFSKVEANTMNRMANIPFEIVSKSTGEAHVVVTDENGYYCTASSWNPHSLHTNRGESGNDGVWFGQTAEGNLVEVDDSLGALPFDTYMVTELPCDANKGKEMVSFEVTIKRDKTTIDLGTIVNEFSHDVEVIKVDTFGEPLAGVALRLVRATDSKVIDEWVSDANAHRISGVSTGTYMLQEVSAAEGYLLAFEPVDFQVHETEPLVQVALHNDLIPQIKTSALDADSGTQNLIPQGEAKVIDTISYVDLVPGRTYTAKGILMDKLSGSPLNAGGTTVESSTTFVAKTPSGAVDVEFCFDASTLDGTSIVVFEGLFDGEHLIATHTDIEDEAQTVHVLESATVKEFVKKENPVAEITPSESKMILAQTGDPLRDISLIAAAIFIASALSVALYLYFKNRHSTGMSAKRHKAHPRRKPRKAKYPLR